MAGNAAFAGGDIETATEILTRARQDAETAASAPLQAIVATDLARVMVTQGLGVEALAELETATSLSPQNAESWLLKATLLRRLDRLDEAQMAIERAVDLAPADPQAGLEAGVIAVLSGRDEAARASWQSVIDLQPTSPAALTAQSYIAQLAAPPVPETQEPS